MPRRLALACSVLALAIPLRAAQPQFWRIEGAKDFLDGDLEGLSVDSEGRVRLAPAFKAHYDTEAPAVWCLARDAKGVLFAGTGNDGKIFRIESGKGSLLFDTPELQVHALAVGPDGKLYAGSSPDGKVYAIDASGKAETFYDPTDKYIWALAFDPKGNLLVATGSEARIHRVDRQGKAEVVFTSTETNLTSLAVDTRGFVYAGSAPGGIVYRIDLALKVFVLHDSAFREVKALDAGSDGRLYAALVDGKDKEEAPRAPAISLPAAASPGASETFTVESVTVVAAPAPIPAAAPRAESPRPGVPKGAVVRISQAGEVETLWSSADDVPHSLLRNGEGVLVGTGNKGKLFRIGDDRTWSMLSSFTGDQVTALLAGDPKGAPFVATSNPGRLFAGEAAAAAKGTFVSKAKDTETVSSWGRLRWDAALPPGTSVQVQTRSGNTSTPDTTWSDWSAPHTTAAGEPVTSERARFLQVRAVLTGKDGASPVLDSVQVAYLQRNLPPIVSSVTVHPAGEVFQRPIAVTGEIEILGLEPGQSSELRAGSTPPRPALPSAGPFGRRLFQRGIQTFTWRAEDPNSDTLVYDVHYRAFGDREYHQLRKGLTDPVVAWDTSTVPNGRYIVRITASDAPGNPEPFALSGDRESAAFEVDNTPPSLGVSLVRRSPLRLRAVARDDTSLLRKAEYSVDGGRWREVYPADGISDSLEETYEIAPAEPGPGTHLVVVRVTDALGNTTTGRVEVPARDR